METGHEGGAVVRSFNKQPKKGLANFKQSRPREGGGAKGLQQSTVLTRKTNISMFGCGNVTVINFPTH